MALTITGKKKKITLQNFLDFGVGLELSKKQINSVLERFLKLKNNALDLIDISFLREEMQNNYKETLLSRYELFSRDK